MGEADTHLKLCKKVAQLTKVIYHLNTRNEDNDIRLAELKAASDAEVGAVVEDAQRKIAGARTEAEAKTKELFARLDELTKGHEREKKKGQAALTEARTRFERETAAAATKLRDAEKELQARMAEMGAAAKESSASEGKLKAEL